MQYNVKIFIVLKFQAFFDHLTPVVHLCEVLSVNLSVDIKNFYLYLSSRNLNQTCQKTLLSKDPPILIKWKDIPLEQNKSLLGTKSKNVLQRKKNGKPMQSWLHDYNSNPSTCDYILMPRFSYSFISLACCDFLPYSFFIMNATIPSKFGESNGWLRGYIFD